MADFGSSRYRASVCVYHVSNPLVGLSERNTVQQTFRELTWLSASLPT